VRTAVLVEPERIEIRASEEPAAGEAQALVRIRVVGICGTDLSIYKGKIPVSYPRIMGHEMVGEVVSAPAGGAAPGSRVIVDPNVFCGRCARCREGRANLCSNGYLMGRDRDGALQELVAAPAENVYHLPEDLDDEVAPLIQVLTTCVHAQRMMKIFPGDSVAIVGLGVTGLLHLQLAKLRGAWPVVCITRSEAKLELARSLGADVTIRAAGDAVARALEATDGGADVAIECAGTVATLAMSVGVARSGGRVLAFGTIGGTPAEPFPFYDLYHKELVLMSPRAAQAEDYPVAIGAVAAGHVLLDPLVTHRTTLEAVGELLQAGPGPDGLKMVVRI